MMTKYCPYNEAVGYGEDHNAEMQVVFWLNKGVITLLVCEFTAKQPYSIFTWKGTIEDIKKTAEKEYPDLYWYIPIK